MRMTINALNRNQSDTSLLVKNQPLIERYSKTVKERGPEVLDYSVEEMLTQIEFDLPV